MDVTFRRATPQDAAPILALWKDSGASASATGDEHGLRALAVNPAAVFVLAVLDGEIVGSLLGTFDGWRGNMYRLVVRPDLRRRGIGRALVGQVEAAFADWGVRRVTALVEVDRPWAAAFWTAVGYPRDERVVRHVGTPGAPPADSGVP